MCTVRAADKNLCKKTDEFVQSDTAKHGPWTGAIITWSHTIETTKPSTQDPENLRLMAPSIRLTCQDTGRC